MKQKKHLQFIFSSENPIFEIKITENTLNHYVNQIVFIQKKSNVYHTIKFKPFENKNRIIVYFSRNLEKEVIKLFKELIDPNKLYCFFIKESEEDFERKLYGILQRTFKSRAFQLIKSNIFLADISDKERQKELLTYHHESKLVTVV